MNKKQPIKEKHDYFLILLLQGTKHYSRIRST